MKLINFKDYEVKKVISEQLRTLGWAIAGIYTYFGITQNKFVASLVVVLLWAFFQICSLMVITSAQNNKKGD